MQMITSRRNATAGHIKKLGADREYRYEQGEFLCDGIRLLREAVAGGCIVAAVFVVGAERFLAENALHEELADTEIFDVTQDVMQYVSPLKTAQEVLFTCKMLHTRDINIAAHNIVLDGIQDPGNVGTIIRMANAFGFDSVILTGACADLYNPKTVRATMGAAFRQNVVRVDYEELQSLTESGLSLYGAALAETSCDIRDADLSGVSIVVGSEGAGISENVLKLCRQHVIIPMETETESLNAATAAGILMWEVYRRDVNA